MSHRNELMKAAGGEWDGNIWTFPRLANRQDLTRGQERLAAEVALSMLAGRPVIAEAHNIATVVFGVLAKG